MLARTGLVIAVLCLGLCVAALAGEWGPWKYEVKSEDGTPSSSTSGSNNYYSNDGTGFPGRSDVWGGEGADGSSQANRSHEDSSTYWVEWTLIQQPEFPIPYPYYDATWWSGSMGGNNVPVYLQACIHDLQETHDTADGKAVLFNKAGGRSHEDTCTVHAPHQVMYNWPTCHTRDEQRGCFATDPHVGLQGNSPHVACSAKFSTEAKRNELAPYNAAATAQINGGTAFGLMGPMNIRWEQ